MAGREAAPPRPSGRSEAQCRNLPDANTGPNEGIPVFRQKWPSGMAGVGTRTVKQTSRKNQIVHMVLHRKIRLLFAYLFVLASTWGAQASVRPPADESTVALAVLAIQPSGEITAAQAEQMSGAFNQVFRDSLHLPPQENTLIRFLVPDTSTQIVDGRSAAEVGILSGAGYILLTRAARKNAVYALRTDLVDTGSGTSVRRWLHRKTGTGEEVLTKAAAEHAAALVRDLLASGIIAHRYGSIHVTTTPDSAVVSVEGHAGGISPCTLSGLQQGMHTILVDKPGYARVKGTILIQPGETRQFSTSLRRQATLSIYTVPERATVLINGVPVGVTPFVRAVPTGMLFDIEVQKKGFRGWRKKVELYEDQEFSISFREQTRKILWISSGALLSATLTYYLLNNFDKKSTITSGDLPGPPGRPQ